MIDRSWIGRTYATSTLAVEAGRLKRFAEAIGAAPPPDAGGSDAPALAPPTFMFAAELDSGATFQLLRDLGVPLGRVLHGEQGFEYHAAVRAGDVVRVKSTVTDIYDKKGGALEFVELRSEAHNQADALVARLRSVLVVRN